jgi:hypothetical protein
MEEEDWPQGDDEQWQHRPYSQPARHSVDPLEHHPLVPIMVITTRISNLDVLLMPDSTTP